MPRTVAKFRRFGDWVEEKSFSIEDKNGIPYIILVESAAVVQVCTGTVTQRGRWRVSVETEAKYKPRTRSYSGEKTGEDLAYARVEELIGSIQVFENQKNSQRSRSV